jgi:transposase
MGSHYDPEAEPTIWRIPDDLWEECRPLLPPEKPLGTPGRPIVPVRRVLDGSLYVLRTGCQWKAVPKEFGAGSTCHRRFQEWVEDGTWQRLWADQLARDDAEHGSGWNWLSADSATVPSPPRRRRHGAGPDQSGQGGHQAAHTERPAGGTAGGGHQRRQPHRHEVSRGHSRQPGRAAA